MAKIENNNRLFTYRYMWITKGDERIQFKVITDTETALTKFEEHIKKTVPDLDKFGKEYIHEYDISLIGRFTDILYKETKNNEKNKDN